MGPRGPVPADDLQRILLAIALATHKHDTIFYLEVPDRALDGPGRLLGVRGSPRRTHGGLGGGDHVLFALSSTRRCDAGATEAGWEGQRGWLAYLNSGDEIAHEELLRTRLAGEPHDGALGDAIPASAKAARMSRAGYDGEARRGEKTVHPLRETAQGRGHGRG